MSSMTRVFKERSLAYSCIATVAKTALNVKTVRLKKLERKGITSGLEISSSAPNAVKCEKNVSIAQFVNDFNLKAIRQSHATHWPSL